MNTTVDEWLQDGSALVHKGGEWRIEPGWTGIGVELFQRVADRRYPWSVLLAFDSVSEAKVYAETAGKP